MLLDFRAPTGTLLFLSLLFASPVHAQSQGTPAKAALVMDLTSGAILLEKDADRSIPPASMSKLMTLNMVFEALEQGLISPEDKFRVSARAAAMGGSKMFVRKGELVSIRDLVRGVIVQSGNDAAVALAEALAGTEEAFAERMTKRAKDIGLANSTFVNSTGWPDPDHRMSVRDLANLSARLIQKFPQYYAMFAETEFTWDGVTQQNRNPLLSLGVGADGLKTGHTEEAGYGLAASAVRGRRRVIMILTGLNSKSERRHESERLINWAFRSFETRKLYSAGENLIEAPVWIGSSDTVPLAPKEDVFVTAPFGSMDQVELEVQFEGPIPAPIDEGAELGYVRVAVPGMLAKEFPLVAKQAVAEGGFLTRVRAAGALLLRNIDPR